MKDKIIVFSFLIYIISFGLLNVILKDNEISSSERRKLKTFPEFKLESEYIKKVDSYLLDHFPLREEFRSIKANFNYNVLNKLDNNSIYLKDNYIFKSNYPTNKDSINNFINIINSNKNLFNSNNIYLMVIPDKNYYIDEDNFLNIDYNYIFDELKKIDIEFIDIRNILTLNDFYETDTHWKQENLDKIIFELSKHMDFEYENIEYTKNKYDKFYGVYYGESALKRKPEVLTYLTNNILDEAKVYYLENNELTSIYNKDNLKSFDAYEVYLDGASAYIEIENNNAKSDKELIIFRDSYGSSLTPLLVNYYKKITLIDLRYINQENYLKYIEINNQDILFMYSTLLINNSFSLKK